MTSLKYQREKVRQLRIQIAQDKHNDKVYKEAGLTDYIAAHTSKNAPDLKAMLKEEEAKLAEMENNKV